MMAFLFSLLTLYVAKPEGQQKTFLRFFQGVLLVHTVLMIVSQFTDLCYYFDSANVYHRSPAYMLSNMAHIVMLGTDVFLLIRWRKISPRGSGAPSGSILSRPLPPSRPRRSSTMCS